VINPALQNHLSGLISGKFSGELSGKPSGEPSGEPSGAINPHDPDSLELHPVGGGSINDTYRLSVGPHRYFCKINEAGKLPGLFEKEKKGLALLRQQHIIRIPDLIAFELIENRQILVLEWIEQGPRTDSFWRVFGEQLAKLHRVSQESFGLDEDNYMGALPQYNAPAGNWTDFFIQQRLEPQLRLALNNGLLEAGSLRQFENLYKSLPGLFPPEAPSLLHGDLWNGNFLCDEQGHPVLIDPAAYFGHRSVDLAMTTLFGGFEQDFYEAYDHHFPLPENYREQWEICNLYPLLIHLNLFGKSYLPDILNTIERF
jgi:fructosamine-3-kinase